MSLSNGIWIWWDGFARVYVDASASFRDTRHGGLCGSFNGDQHDDFTTSEGSYEENEVAFANSWQVSETCGLPKGEEILPCAGDSHRRQKAERKCAKLKADVFAGKTIIIFSLSWGR